jgi:hypothetical protein
MVSEETKTGLAELDARLIEAGIETQWRNVFVSSTETIDSTDEAALNALVQHAASHGRAAMLKSRGLHSLRVNLDKAIKEVTRITAAPASLLVVEQGLRLAWHTGTSLPWAAAGVAVLNLLVAWRSISGLLEVELSDGHAKIVYLLWANRGVKSITLADVHATLDGELGAENVSALLTDLSDLKLVNFGISEVELMEEIILA